jgi:hypothetical protein
MRKRSGKRLIRRAVAAARSSRRRMADDGRRLHLRARSSHRRSLHGLRDQLGGRVSANNPRGGKRQSWKWTISSKPDVLTAIDRLLSTPLRDDDKQHQLEIAREFATETPRSSRRKTLNREFIHTLSDRHTPTILAAIPPGAVSWILEYARPTPRRYTRRPRRRRSSTPGAPPLCTTRACAARRFSRRTTGPMRVRASSPPESSRAGRA